MFFEDQISGNFLEITFFFIGCKNVFFQISLLVHKRPFRDGYFFGLLKSLFLLCFLGARFLGQLAKKGFLEKNKRTENFD